MRSRFLFVPLVVTLCAGAYHAQQPQPAPQQPSQPTFRTEANFVRVDVYPTLRGAPVKDLRGEEFQVLEDGVPQELASFEYVQVRTGLPQEMRDEPNTIQQSRDAMKNPRARVFVLFLDVPHVTIEGAWHIREPLVRMLDRLMGPEDLLGIMTPAMSPAQITFGRKTDVVSGGLRDRWPWGERHTLQEDDKEYLYQACFPWPETRDVTYQMKHRRRERMTLESLEHLVTWLRDQREERKAILTISEGWLLYRRDPSLTKLRVLADGNTEPIPGPDAIGVDPNGRLRVGNPRNSYNQDGTHNDCWMARQALADMDNDRFMRDIIDSANRANATFYTIDPRGLAVFDYPMGPDAPPGLITDANHLKTRTDALRVLADNTDGMAIMGNNNLDPGLRRISDDLTSYYLLGYYSSNARLDGRFRKLTVKVKRPGVDVRARRGYKAPTAEDVAFAKRAAEAPEVPEAVARARASTSALARIRPEARLYAHAIAVQGPPTTIWVAGELLKAPASGAAGVITVVVDGATTSTDITLPAGQRAFVTSIPLKSVPKGPIDVRLRVTPAEEIPFMDAVRIDAVGGLPLPMMFRRGPTTGNRYEPAAQPQFSRTGRARFDVLKVGDAPLTARVLNRDGGPVDVPVTIGTQAEWLTAEITLAALAPGDYIIELSSGDKKVLSAFRVVR